MLLFLWKSFTSENIIYFGIILNFGDEYMNFIEWCNENIGFASLMLSALTLFVSILAIFVSIHTAQLPFKKKLVISTGSYISKDGIGIHVTVTNVGNRNVKIKKIGIFIGEKIYLDKNDLVNGPFDLNQGNEISRYYKQDELKSLIVENNIKASKKLIAFIEDTEGKKKKKKICKVHNL